ncbi:MAG: hypothetical protein HYZ14_00075 [Bacteroidetes bacterium]|nr:hypothetical protein [Bacteroidota bacterium]
MKNRITLLLVLSIASITTNAAEIIDSKRVYNPGLNECISALQVKLPRYAFLEKRSSVTDLTEVETIFKNWIADGQSPAYLTEFDTGQFHYQFVESRYFGSSKTGVFVIVPDTKVNDSFYTELGAGLEIPGTRCVSAHCSWINDGEIFSFIVDRETKTVENFRNWRFEQEDPDFDPLLAYYSQLTIHYKCKNDKAEETTIVQFVDGEARAEIPAWENYPILLPKGKVSVLVFYCNNHVKGVLCFDMSQITKGCPMNFESTVYMKDRMGYERILYTQPQCDDIYPMTILQKTAFEEISNLKWDTITEFKDDVASN